MRIYFTKYMTIVIWMIFGTLNAVILYLLEPKKGRGELGPSVLLGMSGALLGGFSAYLLLGRDAIQLNMSLIGLLALETCLAAFMLSQKAFKKI